MNRLGKLLCTMILGGTIFLAATENVCAEDEWLARFEDFSARAGEVMNLSPAELQEMLAECETYRAKIEGLPESPRKVYRKRLSLSCNMVQFAIQQKSAPPSKE